MNLETKESAEVDLQVVARQYVGSETFRNFSTLDDNVEPKADDYTVNNAIQNKSPTSLTFSKEEMRSFIDL